MRARVLGLLAVSLVLLALPSPAPAMQVAAAPAQPGAGWYLAIVDHGPRGEYGIEPTRQHLVLIAPDGSRRTLLSRRADGARGVQLVDWSPDGATALLLSGREGRQRAIAVDVASGGTTTMRVPRDAASVVLAPDGSGLLVAAFGDRSGEPMSLVAWDGTTTDLQTRMNAAVLRSPGGDTLLTNGPSWRSRLMRVLSATDGSVVRRIPVGGHCRPVRWWDARRALVTCDGDLALLSPETGRLVRLTDRHDGRIGDLGHLDARRIDSGLYVQVAGPCGYEFLGRRRHDGGVSALRVPGAVGDVRLLGATAERLVIQHAQSCDGGAPRSVIARFDPVTSRERVLVRLGRSAGFGAILGYGEVRPLGY